MLIKILSYNLYFHTQLGILNGKQCLLSQSENICISNKIKFLKKGNYDIMCFQEASNMNEITNKINTHDYIEYKSGSNKIMTMFNKQKYKLISSFGTEFSRSRPILVCDFVDKISSIEFRIINIHAPHPAEFKKHLSKVNIDLVNPKTVNILCGDSNDDINHRWRINVQGVKFYNTNTNKTIYKTCCDSTLNNVNNNDKNCDIIFYYEPYNMETKVITPLNIANNDKMMSDHLPISSELEFKIF